MDEAGLELDPGESTVTVDMGELATWMMREEVGLATHNFRARIESVNLMLGETNYASRDLRRDDPILGVHVWRVRTLVLRDPDFHLEIFVSDADAGDYAFLQPGAWIEGIATMSGYCWW